MSAQIDAAPRRVFLRIVVLCIGIRASLQLVGLAALAVEGPGLTWERALGLWSHWDAGHFLRIAQIGYVSQPADPAFPDDPLFIVFFPFFPLAVRALSYVFGSFIVSGLVVSLAASVGASWFLYKLVLNDGDHDRAWRSVVLLHAFPTAYFLSAPYSEALFLFAVVAAVYAARTTRWPLAGLAGALATGTRVTGVALLPALLVESFAGGSARRHLWRWLWVAAAGGGILVYLAVNQVVFDDPFWFLEVQRSHWSQYAIPPWRSISDAVHAIGGGLDVTTGLIYVGRLAGTGLALSLLLPAVRRLRSADSIYAWGGLVLILSASWLISLPRYLLALYPLFVAGAHFTARRTTLWAVLAISVPIQAWLFWRYALGQWAF